MSRINRKEIRTEQYLEETLFRLWDNYFTDIPRKNLVLIHYGKRSTRRLGSIKWADRRSRIKTLLKRKQELIGIDDDDRITLITITRCFQDKSIPDIVVDMTIAHELVHYAHGFHSPLPQLFEKPHQGSIVKKELIKRGLSNELKIAEKWLKDNWFNYVKGLK